MAMANELDSGGPTARELQCDCNPPTRCLVTWVRRAWVCAGEHTLLYVYGCTLSGKPRHLRALAHGTRDTRCTPEVADCVAV